MKTKKIDAQLEAVRNAVDMLGGQRATAKLLKCSQHQIWKAYNGQAINGTSPELAAKLDEATGGKVGKHLMRPDLFKRPYTRKAA